MPMTPTAEERARGYAAADKVIGEFLDDAQKRRPHRTGKRKPSNMSRTTSYREGYFAGLCAAHSMLVLGKFPLIPENANTIMNILRDEDAEKCRPKPQADCIPGSSNDPRHG